MSTFKVKLTGYGTGPTAQGALASAGGVDQRSVWIMGPDRVNRELKDGAVFDDVNYWKRYAYPQVPLDEAIIEVVTDDGIEWLDDRQTNFPRVYDITAAGGSAFSTNIADILSTTGGYAVFAQITNKSTTQDVTLRLNKDDSAIIDLPAGSTQSFQAGDVSISTIEIGNDAVGAVDAEVQILVSISVVPRS